MDGESPLVVVLHRENRGEPATCVLQAALPKTPRAVECHHSPLRGFCQPPGALPAGHGGAGQTKRLNSPCPPSRLFLPDSSACRAAPGTPASCGATASALQGPSPALLAAIYGGEWVENGAILERSQRHIPVRAGERGNTREVGPWVRGLCHPIYLKGAKWRALCSLPGMDVEFSILSAVEQMLLIKRISR